MFFSVPLCVSVYMCLVVTCWERANLLALVCGVCEFVNFPLVSWVRCGTWLHRFLIFAPLFTLYDLSTSVEPVLQIIDWKSDGKQPSTLCIPGNFSCFCRLRIFSKSIFSNNSFRKTISFKKFGSRSGRTFYWIWSGFKLFAKVIIWRHLV